MLIITDESVPKTFWRIGAVSDRERRLLSRKTIKAERMRQEQIERGVLFAETVPSFQLFCYSHIDDPSAESRTEWKLSNELMARFSRERAHLDEMSSALDARRALYHEIPISHRGG
ncbi:hypothetical protein HY312_02700 [Candidatus Saccharibacteria bacterium]|nr:hypothetical protein [Candidatus Saccharibacteria bacterium]